MVNCDIDKILQFATSKKCDVFSQSNMVAFEHLDIYFGYVTSRTEESFNTHNAKT